MIVIGGGPIGCLTAITAARRNQKVLVLESHDETYVPASDHRAIALTRSSQTFLNELDLWPSLFPHAHPITTIITRDPTGAVTLDPTLTGGTPLAHMINANTLKNILSHETKRYPNIVWRYGTTMMDSNRTTNPAFLTLSTSPHEVTTSLIIGCDGAASSTRQRARLPRLTWNYHQIAIVALYGFDNGPKTTAFEIIRSDQSVLAVLPLPNNLFSIVWMVPEKEGQCLMALDDMDFDRLILPELTDFIRPIRLSPRQSTSLSALWVPQIVGHRLALVGDASHRIHPLAGLGLNLGIHDIKALDQHIQMTQSLGLDGGSLTALKRYQRQRRLPHAGFLAATDILNRLFTSPHPIAQRLRTTFIAWGHHSPSLRQLLLESV